MKFDKPFLNLIIFAVIVTSIVGGLLLTQNDPVELTKKEQDERLQLGAAEFLQATVLYYSISQSLPWFSQEERGAQCFETSTRIATVPMESMENCLEVLVGENALRKDFVTSTELSNLYVTNPNPQTASKLDTIVCFQPQSAKWQKDPNTKFNIDGSLATNNRCHSQGGSEYCYWCTQ